MPTPEVSVVIPAHNESSTIVWTIESIVDTLDVPFEIVVVNDSSTDMTAQAAMNAASRRGADLRVVQAGSPLGVANGRNLGALESRGEFLMFLDAHCQLLPGWYGHVRHAFDTTGASLVAPAVGNVRKPETIKGYGVRWIDAKLNMEWLPRSQTEPYLVPLLCGCCQIARRAAFFEIGGYDPMMTRWGVEDHEICLRAWLFGHAVGVAPEAEVLHLFREKQPYLVQWELVIQNMLRCGLLHFTGERLQAMLQSWVGSPYFESSLRRTLSDDTAARRGRYFNTRTRDDKWYFEELVPALCSA